MLGKQWLNRYASTDLRGTAIERSQNRQRKLDGIVAWYFDNVLESLPLMLQAALLLLGCALSHYLWGINTTVACVVLGFTSFGVFFYIFIVAAGAASESCPYQTPGSHALRYLRPEVHKILHSTSSVIASTIRDTFRRSKTVRTIQVNVRCYHPWWSGDTIKPFLKDMILEVPSALVTDGYNFGTAIFRLLAAFPSRLYRLCSTIVAPLVSVARWMYGLSHGVHSTSEQRSVQQATTLDLRCISWMLQTSLDKSVHLSTLKHLATMTPLTDFDPTLVTNCFNAFVGCITVGLDTREVVIIQGLEQLAVVSAMCFFITISHLLVTDPASSILDDIRQRYLAIFPAQANFHGHQSYNTVNAARSLLVRWQEHQSFYWSDYKPTTSEHVMVAHNLAKVAWFKCQKSQRGKVPRFILRFALHSLSLDPPPSTSIVVNSLSIIAIDLGCDVLDTATATSDERCVCASWMINGLTFYQCASGTSF